LLTINVTLRDVALNIGRDVTISIDEQLPTRELLALLVRKLGWPEKDITGQFVRYAMRIDRNKAWLQGDEAIKTLGLLNGDIITLGPVMSSGYPSSQYRPDNRAAAQAQQPQAPLQPPAQQQPQAPYTITPLKRP
jgi:uncharacterized ubiquitin-like protein YukD